MNEGNEGLLLCPLCGHRFSGGDACRPGCPFRRNCGLICCPHCRYQFPGESKLVARWKKFRGARQGKEKA
jgi:hypothetical protein